jgi:hypothetical protein
VTKRAEEDIRRLLAEAVPALPAPADRLAEVGARVHRRRRRVIAGSGAAAAAAVALALGVPNLVLDAARSGPPSAASTPTAAVPPPSPTPGDDTPAGRCPKPGPSRGSVPSRDKPGPLVPTGAVKITLCQARPNAKPAGGVVWAAAPARTLRTDTAAVVAALNALPDRAGLANLPPDARLGCRVPLQDHYTLLLAYPGRSVVVDLDLMCGTAMSGARTRFRPEPVIDTFIDRYRAQLVAQTDPASVPTPPCPAASELVMTPEQAPPDEVSANRGSALLTLPEPLVALTACRYAASGGRYTVEHSVNAHHGEGVLAR